MAERSRGREFHGVTGEAALARRATQRESPLRRIALLATWLGSLLAIFETPLRSIAQAAPAPLRLLPGLWLSDAGLLAPLMVALVVRRARARLRHSPGLFLLLAVLAQGVAIGLLRSNPWPGIAMDLRVLLSVFSGYCLVALLPSEPALLAGVIAATVFAATLMAGWALLTSPYASLYLELGRLVDPTYFVLAGFALCLVAPGITLSHAAGARVSILVSWLAAGAALAMAALLSVTRSSSATLALAIAMAAASSIAVKGAPSRRRRNLGKILFRTAFVAAVIAVLGGAVLRKRPDIQDTILLRASGVIHFAQDENWMERVDEAAAALGAMDGFGQFVGMGFGVESPRPAAEGDVVRALHLGFLNVWWRLGLPWFVFVVLFVAAMGIRYLRCLVTSVLDRRTLICVPGVLSLALSALVSGGWALSAALSIGIVWGLYGSLETPGHHSQRLAAFPPGQS